jgi:hypothetical protein
LADLRHVQKTLLGEMLGILEPESLAIWKVLVYDAEGQKILSPSLKVSELRELGVTLHMYVLFN